MDGKDGGHGGQSPDAMARGWDSLPVGHERSRAPDGWVSGQGVNGDEEETKSREAQQSGWRSEGLRPGSS